MGDPSFNSDERVLIRTPGIHVKSIPFEGTLTNRRIILTDRAKNILPSKDIPLATIQRVGVGVNALQDPILNISVIPHPGETRQMVLTFSRQEGGNRVGERDEWARLIQDYLYGSSVPQSRAPQAPPAPPRYDVVNTPIPPARDPVQDTRVPPVTGYGAARTPAPARAPMPPPQAAQPSGETVFCTRCGNRVAVNSMFCNRCGTPIVAPADMRKPAPAPQQPPQLPAAPAPVAPPVYAPPAPAARVPEEPAYQAPAPVYTPPPAPSPARQTVPRPAAEPTPQNVAKKGFLSGIFGSSKAQKPATTQRPRAPAPEPRQQKSRMPGKKVIVGGIVILVIIAVVAAGAIFVLPNLSSVLPTGGSPSSGGSSLFGGSSEPSTLKTADADSITVKETPAVSVPMSGVWVRVNYMGSYKGTYGMPSDLQTAEDSGDRLFEVVNGTGTIKATVEKKDSSSKRALVVEIYKDGKLLKSGNVTIAFGKVSISADVGGSPVVNGSTSTGSGNVTAKATGNTTQTAAVTTVKTTAPATTTTTKKS